MVLQTGHQIKATCINTGINNVGWILSTKQTFSGLIHRNEFLQADRQENPLSHYIERYQGIREPTSRYLNDLDRPGVYFNFRYYKLLILPYHHHNLMH